MRMHKILECVVGSQAYGTATPQSDVDVKGVYVQHPLDVLGTGYREQVMPSKDETHYEVKRFVGLLQSANPTVLELLYSPGDCVRVQGPLILPLIRSADRFLTKSCEHSFGGYAVAQIRKAKGLDKKMNYEAERVVQRDVLDFCHVVLSGSSQSVPYKELTNGIDSGYGLAKIDRGRDAYALFKGDYPGIHTDGAADVRLASIPKGEVPIGVLFFNKDAYSISCAEWKSYSTWLRERNTQRYVDVDSHGQRIDGKNMLHCRRLLDVAREIATEGTLNVRRPNAAELLAIRRGEVSLDRIISEAEEDIAELPSLFAKSGLPASPPSDEEVNALVLECRGDLSGIQWPPIPIQ